ncbi:MAG: hypothetical protein U0U66_08380 [Cytophagaceae bacterium]
MINRFNKFIFFSLLITFVGSCTNEKSHSSGTIPDDNTVISILTSRTWDLSNITYSQSFDINCDDNYTNRPRINRCQTNVVLELKSDYTYTAKHGGAICIFPVQEESGSWSYRNSELCIGSICYNLIQIDMDGFVLLKLVDSHFDCHSQTYIPHTTAYTYY